MVQTVVDLCGVDAEYIDATDKDVSPNGRYPYLET